MKNFISKIKVTPAKLFGFFFNYFAPFGVAIGMTMFFMIMSIPGAAESQAAKRKTEGSAVYCSRIVKTDTVDEDGFTEYRCFKEEK